jgi:competence ComEA-like helix-hairpin-helix protein
MRAKILSLTIACLLTAAAFADDVELPEGKAKKIIENSCSDCHGLDEVVATRLSSEKWRETVNTMVRRGAALAPAEVDMVVDYLSVYFAAEKVNVNTATAKEIQTALDLTAADAQAIVDYRKANGAFKDLSALEKVKGIDTKRLETNKELIAF